MTKKSKTACLNRLSRIEGQVRGLSRMIEEDRYCIDIVTQIGAVRAALRRVEHELLRDHVCHCVREAMQGGTAREQEQKIEELMNVIARSGG
jgi:DNA-binding FrmR family transcriptional regulator